MAIITNTAGAIPSNLSFPSDTGKPLNLKSYSAQLTTDATTTVTSATAYLSTVVIVIVTVGTTTTITIQDRQGTPLAIVNALATTAASAGNTTYNFQTPQKMVSGISIVTAGSIAATVNIFMTYYQ